ncbi:MAG: histidinol dehydrogenase [Candidatus Hermodarchaeota archaeon]
MGINLQIVNSALITKENVNTIVPRVYDQSDNLKANVISIINSVKNEGDSALIRLTKQYDHVSLEKDEICTPETELKEAYNCIDAKFLDAITYAKQNILKFHNAQKREDWHIEIEPGVVAGQIYRPLDIIGVYVPGGKAIYPSTILMACIPAQIAGVKDIVITSPPQADKKIAPETLVAAQECGVEKIYKIGGAQAIAAMAYGTETFPKVDKIVGPGNKWVNLAKIQVSDVVAIDTPAGPSEILIIADETSNVDFLILDLFSQIEHDPENVGIIVSHSENLLNQIIANLSPFLESTVRKEIIKQVLINNTFIILTRDLQDSIRVSNLIAPEHLELLIANPQNILSQIKHAGAVFIGNYSPVALGDYSAGTNHILPTAGSARRTSSQQGTCPAPFSSGASLLGQ